MSKHIIILSSNILWGLKQTKAVVKQSVASNKQQQQQESLFPSLN
jgi:hypothetical protein